MAPPFPPGAGDPRSTDFNPNTFIGLVTVLSEMVQGQNALLTTLKKLTGNLAANYATNTWVPALGFGGASTGITYGTQLGTVTILGREYICRFKIVLTSKGSATGAATIGGLPATSNADATNTGAGGLIAAYANMSSFGGGGILQVGPSSTSVAILTAGTTGTAAAADTNFTNTSEIDGFFSYFV